MKYRSHYRSFVRWIVFALLLPTLTVVLVATPASAKSHKSKFSGEAPGTVSCSISAKLTFSPPLTISGGGTGKSAITAKLRGCVTTDSSVRIKKGAMTGSFPSAPMSCPALLQNGVLPSLAISWKGDFTGMSNGTSYARRAKFTSTTVSMAIASGSFAGSAALTLDSSGSSSSCSTNKGIKKLKVTGKFVISGGQFTTSLEALGSPTVGDDAGCTSESATDSSAPPDTLAMAGVDYSHGFQLDTDGACNTPTDTWSWHLGGDFSIFTAAVGLDSRDPTGATVEFLNGSTPLTFSAHGESVTMVNLSGVPTQIGLDVANALNLVIQATGNNSATFDSSAIDFSNDKLLGTAYSPPSVSGTSLEALGSPTVGDDAGCTSESATDSSAPPDTLAMAGVDYSHGFQLDTDGACNTPTDTWSWHLGGDFSTFTAAVGLDSRDPTGATVEFLNGSTPLTFSADGQFVTRAGLVSGTPTTVRMNVTGVLNLVIETTSINSATILSSAIDFADDSLPG